MPLQKFRKSQPQFILKKRRLPHGSEKSRSRHSPRASLVVQMVKSPPAMQETQVWFPGREDPLEKEMATHSSILAWRIPWMEDPDGLQFMGSQKVSHLWAHTGHPPWWFNQGLNCHTRVLYLLSLCPDILGTDSICRQPLMVEEWPPLPQSPEPTSLRFHLSRKEYQHVPLPFVPAFWQTHLSPGSCWVRGLEKKKLQDLALPAHTRGLKRGGDRLCQQKGGHCNKRKKQGKGCGALSHPSADPTTMVLLFSLGRLLTTKERRGKV